MLPRVFGEKPASHFSKYRVVWPGRTFGDDRAISSASTSSACHSGCTAASLLKSGHGVLLDVRSPEEMKEMSLDGLDCSPHRVVYLPTTIGGSTELTQVTMASLRVDHDTPVIVFCRSGRRAARAVARLGELGFTRVANGGGVSQVMAAIGAASSAPPETGAPSFVDASADARKDGAPPDKASGAECSAPRGSDSFRRQLEPYWRLARMDKV